MSMMFIFGSIFCLELLIIFLNALWQKYSYSVCFLHWFEELENLLLFCVLFFEWSVIVYF